LTVEQHNIKFTSPMVEPGDTVKVKTEEGGEEKRFSHFKKKNQGRNANAATKRTD